MQLHVNHQVFNELASQPPRKKSRGDSEDWRLSGASIGGKGVLKLTAQILQVFLFTFLPHLKGKKHLFAVSFSHHAIFINCRKNLDYHDVKQPCMSKPKSDSSAVLQCGAGLLKVFSQVLQGEALVSPE